jgi:hypothetical protein
MSVLLLTIISDRFHRTTQHGFVTQRLLFFRLRLLEYKRVVVLVGAHEIRRRCIAADITVDTGRVDVICPGNIFLYAIVSIRQWRNLLSINTYPQITQISQIMKTKPNGQPAGWFLNL